MRWKKAIGFLLLVVVLAGGWAVLAHGQEEAGAQLTWNSPLVIVQCVWMVLGAPVLGDKFDSVLAAFGTLTGSIVGFYFGTRGATPKPS